MLPVKIREIPFPIILPTYIPDKRESTPLPGIDGPLRKYINENYNDFIFGILMLSTEGLAKEDKAHFDHIIQTFEILN